MTEPMLMVEQLTLAYGQQVVLEDFSLMVERGEIACLLGPSGCGKTTALRAIAGFEKPRSGQITVNGIEVAGPRTFMPPEHRKVGVVFQDAALFPHLNVRQNVAFGLSRWPKQAKRKRTDELLALGEIAGLAEKYPHQISGGQRQRVALARAMAPKPSLILFDEPFSNLDADLRDSLGSAVRAILKRSEITGVLVTHDQREAFAMADRIAVVSEGRVQQYAEAEQLYQYPNNRFIAGFLGEGIFIDGQYDGREITCELGRLRVSNADERCQTGAVSVLIRPHDVCLAAAEGSIATVEMVVLRDKNYLYTLALPSGHEIKALLSGRHQIGDSVRIAHHADHPIFFGQ